MDFLRMGTMNIELLIDSSAARPFFHERGVGKATHLEIRVLWFQGAFLGGVIFTTSCARR